MQRISAAEMKAIGDCTHCARVSLIWLCGPQRPGYHRRRFRPKLASGFCRRFPLVSAFGGKIMNSVCRVFAIVCALALIPIASPAQWNKKPYTEWSDKEAMKVLNESPWGQTHTFTDMSKAFSTGPARNTSAPQPESSVRKVNFRIRCLSAKPIREAFARAITLNRKGQLPEQLATQLSNFVAAGFRDYIVVTVDCDSSEAREEISQTRSLLDNRTTADLKNVTYLQAGGKRVFLQEYQSPKADGLGARFLFPRLVDGEPWISEKTDDIHFVSEFSSNYKLDMRYKVKDMMYQGKLEY